MTSGIRNSDRRLVERIAAEEAALFGVPAADVLLMSLSRRAVAARHRAWDRIRAETGWTRFRLGKVWGLDPRQMYRPRVSTAHPVYDARTVAQLRWLHGDDRAASIARGDDHLTQADINSWQRLGAKAAAA